MKIMLKIKKIKTDTLRVTWRKNLVRVIFGFRLGVRDTVRDPVLVLVVWQSLVNRHLKAPWEHVSLIELQTVLKLKVGVCLFPSIFRDKLDFFVWKKNSFGLGGPLPWKGGKEGWKWTKKKIQFFSPHVRYVWWIDRTTARVLRVRSRVESLWVSDSR